MLEESHRVQDSTPRLSSPKGHQQPPQLAHHHCIPSSPTTVVKMVATATGGSPRLGTWSWSRYTEVPTYWIVARPWSASLTGTNLGLCVRPNTLLLAKPALGHASYAAGQSLRYTYLVHYASPVQYGPRAHYASPIPYSEYGPLMTPTEFGNAFSRMNVPQDKS